MATVFDTFEIKDDGSGIYQQKTLTINLRDLKCSGIRHNEDNTIAQADFYDNRFLAGNNSTVNVICDKLQGVTRGDAFYNFKLGISDLSNKGFIVNLPNDNITTKEEFDKKIKELNPVVIGILDTPIITYIPKELVPAILTNKTNIWEVGGAVAASSYKIVQPIDKLAEIEARLESLEAKTNTMAVNVPYVEETYANSKTKMEEVMLNV